jgi:hypothetical protein
MIPIRLVHTSDIHLDTSFASSGLPSRLGDRKREAIRGTLKRILEDSRRRQADLVLIAGDLFEQDRVTPDTIEFLKNQFENLTPIPVFISPGNHDPVIRESPYVNEAWPANVHIFRREEFRSIELPDLAIRVTGFGYERSQLPDRLFAALPVLPADAFNLVLAHGSDTTGVPAGKSAHGPFTAEDLAGKNVDYCALGHYHQQRPVSNNLDKAQIWYSGIPEGRAWDEPGDCGYLWVERDENGILAVSNCVSSQYPFVTFTLNCDGFVTREQIVDGILHARQTSNFNEHAIVRVLLEGAPDPKLDLSKAEIEERLAGTALHIVLNDRTVAALDFETLALDRTLCGHFIRSMNRRIASAGAEERTILERARQYGAEALLGQEVRIR